MKTLAERVAFAEKNSALVDKYHLRELLREAMGEIEKRDAALKRIGVLGIHKWDSLEEAEREMHSGPFWEGKVVEAQKIAWEALGYNQQPAECEGA